MSNARRGRHYRTAQKEVETKQAIENASYVQNEFLQPKYIGLGFAFVMLLFVKGIILGYLLGSDN